jgi:hypothetical protein
VKISEHFSAEFMRIEHTIPEAVRLRPLDTPVRQNGFLRRLSPRHRPGRRRRSGLEVFERLGKMNIHTAFIDSTNVELDGLLDVRTRHG